VLSDRFEHSRDANTGRRVQFERVAPIGVDVAPNDVAALEASDGAYENASLAHDEVLAFDKQEAEIAGEVGLLGVGQAQRTGAQDRNSGLGPLAGRFKTGAE